MVGDSSYSLARSVSVLDAVNWIALAVKKIKTETVKKKECFPKTGFGESDVAYYLEETSENIAAISILCRERELSCDTKDFVPNDDHLATYYSFEPSTALIAVRNTQNIVHCTTLHTFIILCLKDFSTASSIRFHCSMKMTNLLNCLIIASSNSTASCLTIRCLC
jgi:hypothetical protein